MWVINGGNQRWQVETVGFYNWRSELMVPLQQGLSFRKEWRGLVLKLIRMECNPYQKRVNECRC